MMIDGLPRTPAGTVAAALANVTMSGAIALGQAEGPLGRVEGEAPGGGRRRELRVSEQSLN